MTEHSISGETLSDKVERWQRTPIPADAGAVEGWKEVPIIAPSKEELTLLGSFSDAFPDIATSAVYAGEHAFSPYQRGSEDELHGALYGTYLRTSVAERLRQVQGSLPKGVQLMVFDGYRPQTVQRALYDFYLEQLKSVQPGISEQDAATETQKYVSLPSSNKRKPSPHNTGTSVDVVLVSLPLPVDERIRAIDTRIASIVPADTDERYELEIERSALLRENAHLLDFGTPFDYGSEEAALAYYEHPDQADTPTVGEARKNRRLLYWAMTEAGFMPLASEYWHFNDPRSQMGAAAAGKRYARFGMARFSSQNEQEEEIRRGHAMGMAHLYEAQYQYEGLKVTNPDLQLAINAVKKWGNIHDTATTPDAVDKIAPQK